MRECFAEINFMEMEHFGITVEISMKVNGKKVKNMVKENFKELMGD